MCISFISNEVGIFFSWQFFPLCDVPVPEICLFVYTICLSLLICGNSLSVLCGTTIFSQFISCLCIFLHSFLKLGYNSYTLKHIRLKYTTFTVFNTFIDYSILFNTFIDYILFKGIINSLCCRIYLCGLFILHMVVHTS